jgi:hypothetical protein
MWYTKQEFCYIYRITPPLPMEMRTLNITDIFKNFARGQQALLREHPGAEHVRINGGKLDPLLALCARASDISLLRQALLDSYFPLGMLEQTMFSDVEGMRFFICKRRPDLEPVLAAELGNYAEAFLRIRLDIETLFDPMTITCIPLDGQKHELPVDQWCTLCGVCCQIGGVPPEPPAGLSYPDHWYKYLGGGAVPNQQLCPFLFQYFGEERFFCAIHNVKPMSCRYFDEKECRQRLAQRSLHALE